MLNSLPKSTAGKGNGKQNDKDRRGRETAAN